MCINILIKISSHSEGYDQIESGAITTEASVQIFGTAVPSQVSNQNIELKVTELLTTGKTEPTYPIQKKNNKRVFKNHRSFTPSNKHLQCGGKSEKCIGFCYT